jgi:MFS transporter, putative metabolite transport protein
VSVSPAELERIEYDDAPVRLFHFRVAIGASGGEFSDGFGLGIIGIALSLATPALHLTALWTGLIGGASLVGIFVGALFAGPAADRLGRRPIFACNMAVLGVLSLLQVLAASSVQLLALRLAIGVILGTDYAVNKPMLIEFTPRRVRGKLLGMLSVAWAVGYATAYFVGFALQSQGPDAWHWMLLASAAPCLLVLPLRITVPETPLWLMRHGQTEQAARIVRQRLGANVALPVCHQDALVGQHRWRKLFSPMWRRRTLLGCAFFSCLVIPYFAVGTFVSQVLSAMKLQSPYGGGLVYNLTLLAGGVAGMLVADHLSRRRFLIGSFAVAAATMLILTLWRTAPALAITILFALFAGVLSAASNLVYVYLPELFPTELRASGIGLSSAVSRIGSAVSTFLLPVVVATYGIRTALAACVAVLAIGTAICQRWAPETGQLRLAELEQASAAAGG